MYIFARKNRTDKRSNPLPVLLIVRCAGNQAETVEKILEEHQALGLARHYGGPKQGE